MPQSGTYECGATTTLWMWKTVCETKWSDWAETLYIEHLRGQGSPIAVSSVLVIESTGTSIPLSATMGADSQAHWAFGNILDSGGRRRSPRSSARSAPCSTCPRVRCSSAPSSAGNPGCHCARDSAARHGPYYEWSYLKRGRPHHRTLTPKQAEFMRLAIANYRKAKKLLRVWENHTQRLIELNAPK